MKNIGLALLLLLLSAPASAQQTAPELPFESVPDFLKLPAGMNFGEVPGVAVNSRGHVFVFTRSNSANGPAYGPTAAQLLEFGPNGEFIGEVGKGLYGWAFAHSVRIDRDDNIWAIDEDAGPHEHVDPPLAHVDGLFRQPTDVAWDSAGNTYISDGYINSRVAKIDRNGDWVKSWGEKGTGLGQFQLPHAIAIDRNNNVYVGDRTNRRVQVFDTEGKFLRMFSIDIPPVPGTKAVNGATPTGARLSQVIGQPNSLCINPTGNQVLFVGESTFPGRIFKVSLDGKVIGIIGRSGRNLKQFSGAHAIACPAENEIYIAETSNWRVQKVVLRPQARRSSMTQAGKNTRVDNGVNVEALLGAREALTAAPQAAQFTWRAKCQWMNGVHSHSTVESFYGLGQEQAHKKKFTFDADHPEVFAAEDKGATPVEYVLVALASCLTGGIAAVAQNRGIQLRSVSATVEGGMDLQGILGIDRDVRNGFDGIKVTYNIDADAPPEEIRALVAQSQKRSAVYDVITNPTNVTVNVA